MKLYSILPALAVCLASQGAHAVTCQPNLLPSNPDTAYTLPVIDNGTVTHAPTGLTWKRCGEGQSWSGGTCTGTAGIYTWAQALALAGTSNFAGYNDWRLPNVKELRSLVEECRSYPAINDTIFPAHSLDYLWSSSPTDEATGTYTWVVDFIRGLDVPVYRKGNSFPVQLVRGGDYFDKLSPLTTSLLSISASGTGNGSVSSDASDVNGLGQVSCTSAASSLAGTCLITLPTNSNVTLTAAPASGGSFSGWSGVCSGTLLTCTVNMNAAKAVTAAFSGGTPVPTVPGAPPVAATTVPGAPTGLNPTPGDASALISFAPPTSGGAATSYFASCTATGATTLTRTAFGSPIAVIGMTNGTTYSCTVRARNSVGDGPSTSVSVTPVASISVTPAAPLPSTGCYPLSNINESSSAEAHNGSMVVTSGGVDAQGVTCPGWGVTSNNPDWITVGSTSAVSGSTTSFIINYSVAAYTGTSPRTGTLSIGSRTYTIAQYGPNGVPAPTCTLTALPASITTGDSSTLIAKCTPTAASYVWTGGNCAGTNAASCTDTPAATTPYTVQGTNSIGTGMAATATVTVNSPAPVLVGIASQTDVRVYVPVAYVGFVSSLRIINSGTATTQVKVARIDGTTGVVGAAGTLTTGLPVHGAMTFTAQQIEAALASVGTAPLAASDRPRIRVTGVSSALEVQSFLLQPGGLFSEMSGMQSGTEITIATYVPAAEAATGYINYIRVINPGAVATPVSIALIDAAGTVGPQKTLIASMPAGAAQTFSSVEIESLIGTVAAGLRPRLLIAGNTVLEAQSFLTQPGGGLTIISTGQ